MTAKTHQNRSQTSQAKSRSGSRNKNRTASSVNGSRPSSRVRRRKSEKSSKGARVIWMMVIVGGLIGSIFILAQRLQMNTLHLKRMEEGLKSEIDTLASQQPYLNFQKDKALSTQESQKAASEFNLTQPGVGRAVVHQSAPETKPVLESRLIAQKNTKSVTKQPVKVTKNAKLVLTGKTAKPAATGKPAQASKAKKDSKQMAGQVVKNQPSRKGARN